MVETVTTTLFDYLPSLRRRKPAVVAGVCFIIFLMGLSLCLEGGILMFELFFWFSAGISVIILAITQIIGVVWVYGFRRFMSNIKEMGIYIPAPLYAYWLVSWIFVTPVLLVLICALSIYYTVPAYWGDYVFPPKIQALGWLLTASSMGLIPLGFVVAFCRNKGSLKDLFRTSDDLCPAHARKKGAKQESKASAPVFRYVVDQEVLVETAVKVYPDMPQT